MSPRRLAEEYWDRAPVHIPGTPDKFAELGFDLEIFFRLCEKVRGIKAQFFDSARRHNEMAITGAQARALFDAGMTICAGPFDDLHDGLRAYAREIKRGLQLPGRVIANCYLSPAGRGFGAHFDDHSVIILQIEGEKTWFHGTSPAIVQPPRNVIAEQLGAFHVANPWVDLHLPREDELRRQVLKPGDTFYLPAGTWHRAEAGEYSLAVTIACHSISFQDLLLRASKKQLDPDASWRRRIPATVANDAERGPRRLLAERLAQAQAWLASVDADVLLAEWQKSVDGDEEPGPDAERKSIARDDVLIVPHRISCTVDGETVKLQGQGSEFAIPLAVKSFVERLAERERFVAHEALGFCAEDEELDWEDVREALETLLDAGLIRRG